MESLVPIVASFVLVILAALLIVWHYVTVEDQSGQRRNAWSAVAGTTCGCFGVDFQWDE